MLETLLILAAVLLAVTLTAIGRKKEAGHQNAVAEIKSEIADGTNMTAKIAVFADGRRTACIVAASEEISAFFYYRVVGAQVVEKYTFGLDRIIQSRLYINGQEVPFGYPADEVTASAFAHEMSTSEVAMPGSARLAAIRSISIEVGYQGSDRPKVLAINIINMPEGDAAQQTGKLMENAVWWAAFLRAASSSACRMAEEEAARMRMAETFSSASVAAESKHTAPAPETHTQLGTAQDSAPASGYTSAGSENIADTAGTKPA